MRGDRSNQLHKARWTQMRHDKVLEVLCWLKMILVNTLRDLGVKTSRSYSWDAAVGARALAHLSPWPAALAIQRLQNTWVCKVLFSWRIWVNIGEGAAE
jgi:hypothetical protein